MSEPRLFHLQREHDVTGASGTGRVADGVLWPDGTVSVRWCGQRKSTVNWDRLEDAEAVHGHGGATRIVWEVDDRDRTIGALRSEVATLRTAFTSRGTNDLARQLADATDALAEAKSALADLKEDYAEVASERDSLSFQLDEAHRGR